jgi:protein-S-isoprenylcysteine O-methyltransferase Ste14
MADAKFKRVWTLIVPAAVERSTYVLVVGVFTFGLIALWSPLDLVLWDFEGTWLGATLLIGYFLGWAITLFSTFLINHFQLFGLLQAWEHLKSLPSKEETFVTPLFYKLVRHPMMTGVLIALWCAPTLTLGRLILNLGLTAYILMGLHHEEKTLVQDLGDEYRTYQRSTPMLVPGFRKGSAK